jgi:hypothetical protein
VQHPGRGRGLAGTIDSPPQSNGGRFTAPADATSVDIHPYNYMNTGWVAYDDVSLQEVIQYCFFNGQRVAMRQGDVLY